MINNKVVIIGAGPSGLASAKSCLECNLEPVVIEKYDELGGLWNQKTGFVWDSMSTNLSRYACSFSDFPWPNNTPMFPSQKQVQMYLYNYAKHFKILDRIQFSTEVTHIERKDGRWRIVCMCEDKEPVTHEVKFVIMATGIFSKPHVPTFKQLDLYKGDTLHSSDYRSPEVYRNKVVTVIGNGFSGTEIAAEVSTVANKVVHIIRRPKWIMSRYLSPSPEARPTPIDLLFYSRAAQQKSLNSSQIDNNIRQNAFFGRLSNQGEIHSALRIEDKGNANHVFVAISDHYLDALQSRKIEIRQASIQCFTHDGLTLTDQDEALRTDAVIFCTGYKTQLPLEPSCLNDIEFAEDDQFQPFLLYKCTFHPHLPNMAFPGMYRGPYFGVMELQARWAAMIFKGEVSLPNEDTMIDVINDERRIRWMQPRLQFPHGDYVNLADSIATEIGVLPDFHALKNSDPNMHDQLWNQPAIPAHYRLYGPYANLDCAQQQMHDLQVWNSQINRNDDANFSSSERTAVDTSEERRCSPRKIIGYVLTVGFTLFGLYKYQRMQSTRSHSNDPSSGIESKINFEL